jgi:xanthine dehydrogenase large subunit
MDNSTFEERKTIAGSMHSNLRHDSAHKHVSGTADYIDDIPEPAGTLHGALGMTDRAHAAIVSMDLSEVEATPGVVCVLTAKDMPHSNDISPSHLDDEPVLAEGLVQFHGQPAFAVIAETRDIARRAARKAKITYRDLPHHTDILDALENGAEVVTKPLTLSRGDAEAELELSPRRLTGRMRIGGQDHFYLESHIAMAIPGEDDEITSGPRPSTRAKSSTWSAMCSAFPQMPSPCRCAAWAVRFGGKETQGNQFAAVAAVAAKKYQPRRQDPPDRDDDMTATGKRHDFLVDYEVGFDDDGRIEAVKQPIIGALRLSSDLSGPVTDRALFHADNSYFYPHVRLRSRPLKTNTVSNTAFRGFGGPQGMVGGERMIEDVAYALGKDPLDIRKLNFYGGEGRNLTPYHQTVEDNIIGRIIEELETSCDYATRRAEVLAFNRKSQPHQARHRADAGEVRHLLHQDGIQSGGALVHLYADGSIHLNHGGTEMGQGLYTKVAQVVADEFQVDLDRIKVTATTTGKVPNTSATAASSGSDLNGMAAVNAAQQIKARLVTFAAERWGVSEKDVAFEPNMIRIGAERIAFSEFIKIAYGSRIQLSAAGFYKTPKIHWNRAEGRGRPFFYYAYGASCSEVSVDTLTGEYQVDRTDVLHDVGKSLNPALDIGQVEGAFVQGMGWLTTEELWWDAKGGCAPMRRPPTRSRSPPTGRVSSTSSWLNGRLIARRRSAVPRLSASRPSCCRSRFWKQSRWRRRALRSIVSHRALMRPRHRNGYCLPSSDCAARQRTDEWHGR